MAQNKANQAENIIGRAAPAHIKLPYWSTYFHIPSGKNYRQLNPGTSNNWVEITETPTVDPVDPIIHPDVALGNSLFVSSAGKTIANGAIRESITNHFSNLEEARDRALAGDTIYVRGDHTVTSNLAKDNVSYWFLGRPTITYNSGVAFSFMWGDGGVDMTINIKGDAIFLSPIADRQVIDIAGANTNYDINCHEVIGGGIVVFIHGGTDESVIRVENKIENTVSNESIRLNLVAKGTIICPLITNTAVAGFRYTLRVRQHTGNFKIVGDLKNDTFDGTRGLDTIFMDSSGTGTVNIIGDVYADNNIDDDSIIGERSAILISSTSYTLNLIGDVYGFNKFCFEVDAGGNSCTINHVGNQTNTGTRACVSVDATAIPSLTFKGIIHSTGAVDVITTAQTGGVLKIEGSLINSHTPGAPTVGINLGTSASYQVILRNLDIQIKDATATPYAISAVANKDIKVFHSVGSNVGYNNITNLIAGTIFITDSDYLTF